MITDETGRYAVTALNGSTLWRFDGRWRRAEQLAPADDRPFEYLEGRHHFLLVRRAPGSLWASVCSPTEPQRALATGAFHDGAWTFEGDAQAWADVPEHVLMDRVGGHSLVRIADDAESDPLDGFGKVARVVEVPDSRLVVLAGEGVITVYDPKTRVAGIRFRLKNGNDVPTMRFRAGGSELWIDDVDTMLKIETVKWEVVDAAGSEPGDDDDGHVPRISAWCFTADESLVVITRPSANDVLVVDATTMEPVDRFTFDGAPIDATVLRRKVVATDAEGRALRAALRR